MRHPKSYTRSAILAALLTAPPLLAAQAAPLPVAPVVSSVSLTDALPWDAKTQGARVMSLARDLAGETWVGTEDDGVWRYAAGAGGWTHFTDQSR